MQAALVFPLTTLGIMLASATRKLATPETQELRIDNAADPARAAEVVNGQREMQREILQERVAWCCAFAVPMFGSKLRGRHRAPEPLEPLRRR